MRSRLSTSARFLSAACATALLSACAVGPGAPEATLPPPASGAFIGQGLTAQVSPAEARSDWWRLYNDPVLDGLILQALAENNELEAAAANLRLVRASLSEARSARLPVHQSSAPAQHGRQAAYATPIRAGVGRRARTRRETYDVGLDVAYEIDLFGRVSSAIRAARADADAAQAALEVVQVTVAAETARAYADACSANARIAVAERTIGLQQETADLTQRLLDLGRGTGLDTARAGLGAAVHPRHPAAPAGPARRRPVPSVHPDRRHPGRGQPGRARLRPAAPADPTHPRRRRRGPAGAAPRRAPGGTRAGLRRRAGERGRGLPLSDHPARRLPRRHGA